MTSPNRGPNSGRNQPLPWGHWLTQIGYRAWRTARAEAGAASGRRFWVGRLGFPSIHFVPEQQELLLRVLSTIERGTDQRSEGRHELFSGDMLFWRFYICWIVSIGLADVDGRGNPLKSASDRGGAAGAPYALGDRRPRMGGVAYVRVVDAVRRAHHGGPEELREAMLQSFERESAARPTGFARKTVGRSHM